jgi:hypothetical protein
MPTCLRRKKTQVRTALIDAHTLTTEAKHFKNLHLQESRLRRQYKQDAQELQELQTRRRKEKEEQEQAKKTTLPKTLAAAHGFEFTNFPECGKDNATGTDRQSSDVVLSGTISV